MKHKTHTMATRLEKFLNILKCKRTTIYYTECSEFKIVKHAHHDYTLFGKYNDEWLVVKFPCVAYGQSGSICGQPYRESTMSTTTCKHTHMEHFAHMCLRVITSEPIEHKGYHISQLVSCFNGIGIVYYCVELGLNHYSMDINKIKTKINLAM